MAARKLIWQRILLPAVSVILLAGGIVGCGSDAPFAIVPVEGVVTYEDGSPIPASGYRLRFQPLVESPDGRNFPRVAIAVVDGKGRFEATTQRYGDGIIQGQHRVYFERLNPESGGKLLVPAEFTDPQKSPLRIDTSEGRTLEIKVPKPK